VVLADNSIVIERPYPNPSAGDLYFNIILTGDEHPDTMFMEIINGNGQNIASFSKHDLFVGTNVLLWQRQNILGGRVPKGMYLYRMRLTQNGKAIKTATGKFILN
jgi:flagellar hook assembly protein FlgD